MHISLGIKDPTSVDSISAMVTQKMDKEVYAIHKFHMNYI